MATFLENNLSRYPSFFFQFLFLYDSYLLITTNYLYLTPCSGKLEGMIGPHLETIAFVSVQTKCINVNFELSPA